MLALTTLLGIAASAMPLSATPAPAPDAAPCAGAAPPRGAVLRGPVLRVLDGVTLCVAAGATPDKWVPLELANARKLAPARGALMAVAFSQNVTCHVVGASGGTSIANCMLNGRPLTAQIEEPDAIRAGLSWR